MKECHVMTGEIRYTYRELKTFVNLLAEIDLDKEVILWDTTDPDDEIFCPLVGAVMNANGSELAEELELCDHPCILASR